MPSRPWRLEARTDENGRWRYAGSTFTSPYRARRGTYYSYDWQYRAVNRETGEVSGPWRTGLFTSPIVELASEEES